MLISIDQLVARSNLLAKVLSHRKWAPWMAPVPFAQTSEELACDQRLHIAVLVHVQGIVDQGLMIKKCSNIITYIYIYIYICILFKNYRASSCPPLSPRLLSSVYKVVGLLCQLLARH